MLMPIGMVLALVFNDLKGQYMLLSLPSWNTLAPQLVRSLVAQGYFHGWDTATGKPSSSPVRVGLLGFDSPIQRRVNALLAAELTKAGYKPYSLGVNLTNTYTDHKATLIYDGPPVPIAQPLGAEQPAPTGTGVNQPFAQ